MTIFRRFGPKKIILLKRIVVIGSYIIKVIIDINVAFSIISNTLANKLKLYV